MDENEDEEDEDDEKVGEYSHVLSLQAVQHSNRSTHSNQSNQSAPPKIGDHGHGDLVLKVPRHQRMKSSSYNSADHGHDNDQYQLQRHVAEKRNNANGHNKNRPVPLKPSMILTTTDGSKPESRGKQQNENNLLAEFTPSNPEFAGMLKVLLSHGFCSRDSLTPRPRAAYNLFAQMQANKR